MVVVVVVVRLTRSVEGRTSGVGIGDGVTSACAVTVRRAGGTSAVTATGYNPPWTRAATLPIGVDSTAAAASTASSSSGA